MPPIQPSSSFAESADEANRRQRDIALPRTMRTQRRNHLLRNALIIAAVIVVLLAGGTALAAWNWKAGIDSQMATQLVKVAPGAKEALQPTKSSTEPFYMLILGADARPGENESNSDTLILARIDPQNKKVALISIPRDSRAKIPGHGYQKINSAMIYGGPALAIQTVHDLTGLPISHFVQINFDGFKDIVDAIGGVWVNVPKRIFDPRAANHDFTAELIKPGYQKLDGKHALTFVRSRRYADADYTRMRNQQTFIKALVKQTLQAGNIFKINAITNATVKNIVTDMKPEELLALAADFKDMDPKTLETVTMPSEPKTVDGVDYVVINHAKMDDLVRRLANGQPIDKSVEASSAAAAADAAAKSSIDPATVTLTVRNGAGGPGVALSAANKLKAGGFQIKEVGNAARFVYDTTLIIYKDDKPAAEAALSTLGYGSLVKSNGRYSFKTTCLVVVGKDWKAAMASAAQ